MAFSQAQFMAFINGVRSICDELLDLSEAEPDTYAGGPDLATPPGTPPAIVPPGTPPAIVPPGTPPAIVPPGTPPEVDAEGIPWDERIHTAKKSKLKSDVWRLKPGVDALLVAQVKSELTLTAQAAAPVAPVAPAEAVQAATAPPVGPMTWSDLLNKIVGAGKTPEEVLTACTACGVENIGKLQDSPELIPNVAMVLGLQ